MRIILHLDMDAFFASIEERDREYLKGKAIVVGADPKEGKGRGVVSTANYKAREYGISSGMPILKAWEIAKEVEKNKGEKVYFVAPDFEKYQKVSQNIFEILKKFSPKIEKASIDEFYLDLSFLKSFFKAKKVAQKIKKEIFEKEKLTASIGIGPNKFIAKIASQMKKPNGEMIVLPEKVKDFLLPLSIKEIPGIGPKTEEKLAQMGIKKVKDLRKLSLTTLKNIFGKRGEDFYQKARGVDQSEIVSEEEIKSLGKQITLEKDTLSPNVLLCQFSKILKEVFEEFEASKFKSFRTIILILRFSDFKTKTVSKTFKKPIFSKKDFEIQSLKLLLPFLDQRKNPKRKKIRLFGIRIKNFNGK